MKPVTQYYPIGIQSFETLRSAGYVYIDKTRYIKELVARPRYVFLSRPRRFGKSLLLSTMEAYFNGKRELFKNLALDSDDVDWTPRPVIKLSFSKVDPKSDDDLYQLIGNTLADYECIYGRREGITSLPQRLEYLIKTAYETTGRKVAVLIDEYDVPLLSTLENPGLNTSFRNTLRSLFTVVKDLNDFVYFEFVTGVSRFSQTSLFSGANNLNDITMLDEYAGICGITEEELRDNLLPGIEKYARKEGLTTEEAFAAFKNNYDGYHFAANSPDIYNPFSLLKALEFSVIDDFWFETGTPDFLLKVIKEDDFHIPDLECMEVASTSLGAVESYMKNPVALMLEAGYLTIKSYDKELGAYRLGLPNEEVAGAFSRALLPIYSGYTRAAADSGILKMRSAIIKGDVGLFIDLLREFLAGNPYGNTELKKRESYFRSNLYLVLKALGFKPYAELQTCMSRMDLMLETRRYIYIFELKVDGSSHNALRQIDDRKYAEQWRHSGKTIIKVGVNYNSQENNIDAPLIERVHT